MPPNTDSNPESNQQQPSSDPTTTSTTTPTRQSTPPNYRPRSVIYQPSQSTLALLHATTAPRSRATASSSGNRTERPGECSNPPVSYISPRDVKKWIKTGTFGKDDTEETPLPLGNQGPKDDRGGKERDADGQQEGGESAS